MKYETPKLALLSSAIDSIQSTQAGKNHPSNTDSNPQKEEDTSAYADWE